MDRSPENSFQAMAEVLSLGMSYQLACSPDGAQRRFLYVSDSCLALNGVSAQAVMDDARVFYELVTPEHRQLTHEVTTRAILDRKPLVVEYAMRKPDGEIGWRRATSAPRSELTPEGWSLWDGLQVDITEQKLAEQALTAERRKVDLAVRAAGLGFWDYDIAKEEAVWSDRTKALYGLPPDARLDYETWMSEAIHPDDRPAMEAAYAAALAAVDGLFTVEHRAIAPDGDVRWLLAHGRILREGGEPRRVLGTVLDITERREAEERRRLVMGELAHRSRNGLQMILAIVRQTARSARSMEDFEDLLVARIEAMARSQDLVTSGSGPLTLADLFASALDPFDRGRFELDPLLGAHRLSADAALMLALLVHELGTNATKYGALSAGEGRISLSAGRAADGMAAMIWREAGGPAVSPPTRNGFGSRLMEAALRGYGGSVEATFSPAGFEARIEFPVLEA